MQLPLLVAPRLVKNSSQDHSIPSGSFRWQPLPGHGDFKEDAAPTGPPGHLDGFRKPKVAPVSISIALWCCLMVLLPGCNGLAAQAASSDFDRIVAQPVQADPNFGFGNQHWQTSFDAGYVYAVGLGHPPQGDSGTAEAWAHAKRAAIDNAMANLLLESRRIATNTLPSLAGSMWATERPTGPPLSLHGALEQAELVNVIRSSNGACRVLMRMPYPSIQDKK